VAKAFNLAAPFVPAGDQGAAIERLTKGFEHGLHVQTLLSVTGSGSPPPALFEPRAVLIVASVSCIYGLGDPNTYYGMLLLLEPGGAPGMDAVLRFAPRSAQTRKL